MILAMPNPETEIGGQERSFPSTSWTALGGLLQGDEAARRRRLEDLIARYWKPIYCVIRASWAKSNEDAKDLTQEFFARAVLEGRLADGVDPEKGSFRAFLKGALSNFMLNVSRDAATLKRGGQTRTLRFDDLDPGMRDLIPDAASMPADRLFDAAWKEEVLGRALRLAEARLQSAGKLKCFQIFKRYDLEAGEAPPSYEELSREFGVTPHVVKHSLGTAREEYRVSVTSVLRDYLGTPELVAQEIRELFGS